MAELNVLWTSTAVKQRNYVFEYWNERNKSNNFAIKLNNKINERVKLLKTNPKLGKKVDFVKTRSFSLGHYSILYQKIDSNIIITGFWDNRQDPKRLAKFLKNN